jgi:hypothetical protein
MKRRHYFFIFLIGLLFRIGVGLLQNTPGYMDAEYYFIGGRNLAQGNGFSEFVIWNYLDDPSEIPHPSHGYWMPLASILAAIGMILTQSQQFAASQIIFILISSMLPPLTAYLCVKLTKDHASAILAGGLAILSGFYLPFMTTSDTFAIYAILGALYFILLSEPIISRRYLTPIAIGLVAGLMHLARTDGILWLGVGLLSILTTTDLRIISEKNIVRTYFDEFLLVIVGYLVIMGPWFIRNYLVFQSLLAPGGSLSIWILKYDEIFIFPAEQLSVQRWLSAGLSAILGARLWAMSINLQRSIAEQGLIFLTPFILLGLWISRKDRRIQWGIFAWLCTFFLMTFIFPFQGARGGFFHSSAALLPLFWSTATIGFNSVLDWAHRVRNWNLRQSRIVFSIAIIIFTLFLTIFNAWNKFAKNEKGISSWEDSHVTYQQTEDVINEFGAAPDDIVMTINPPGYHASTYRSAIAIPDGDIYTALEVAKKFGATYLVLEEDHPEKLDELYQNPRLLVKGINLIATIDHTYLYIIE